MLVFISDHVLVLMKCHVLILMKCHVLDLNTCVGLDQVTNTWSFIKTNTCVSSVPCVGHMKFIRTNTWHFIRTHEALHQDHDMPFMVLMKCHVMVLMTCVGLDQCHVMVLIRTNTCVGPHEVTMCWYFMKTM